MKYHLCGIHIIKSKQTRVVKRYMYLLIIYFLTYHRFWEILWEYLRYRWRFLAFFRLVRRSRIRRYKIFCKRKNTISIRMLWSMLWRTNQVVSASSIFKFCGALKNAWINDCRTDVWRCIKNKDNIGNYKPLKISLSTINKSVDSLAYPHILLE